jgi:N,N'-diacetyllegionaminate synthase
MMQTWDKIVDPARTFIIAEAGVNHNGRMDLAEKLIDTAWEAGADAVKFQTFKAEKLAAPNAPKASYQVETTGGGETQHEMLKKLELPPEWHQELMAYALKKGILFLSTPFDEESADLLESLDLPFFKIGSGEITNEPFLKYLAAKGRPLLLSTGMSYLNEVIEAVEVIRQGGGTRIALMHCVSNYPADPADANLRALQTMRKATGLPVGYSDHTPGIEIALAAVALGACVVEKHFTLDRRLAGPDHRASLEPNELRRLVHSIRNVEQALGHGRKEPALSEADTAQVVRKSLVAARDMPAGTCLTEPLIAIKRPGTGLKPSLRSELVGRTLRVPIQEGQLFQLGMVA